MSVYRKSGKHSFHSFQTLANQFERKSVYIPQSFINNINQNITSGSSKNSLYYKINNLDDIFKMIIEESKTNSKSVDSYQSIKLLETYIRKNRNNIDSIGQKICENENDLDENLLTYIIELVPNLIIENRKLINYLQIIIPFLINTLSKNIDLTCIGKINATLKRLIRIGGNKIRKVIEEKIEELLQKFYTDSKNLKYENTKYAYIQFFCVVLKSAPTIFYSNFIQGNNIRNFLKILENFKSSKIEIRQIIGQLVVQIISMVTNREKEMKNNYPSTIYIQLYSQYEKHLQENGDIPNNLNLFSGFITILISIYLSYPIFFKNQYLYSSLVKNILKAKNSRNNLIKIEFINFAPQLYKMNKELFIEKYINFFLEYCISLLNIKTNADIRSALFLTLGNFSLNLKPKIFEPVINPLLNLIYTLLTDKKTYDKEIYKCLSDLINNKDKAYVERVMKKLDLNFLLSKLFKTKISTYKIEFLISIMKAYDAKSIEHITTVIISLNVIGLIFCDEDFNLNQFYEKNEKILDKITVEQIENDMANVRKYLRKYFSQKNDDYDSHNENNLIYNNANESKKDVVFLTKSKCLNDPKIVKYGLNLLSKIDDELFFKDMLIFYNEKLMPLIFYINDTKIINKILDIMLCKFVKIYEDDKNFSEYILKSILDGLKNIIFSGDDILVVLHAFNILHQNNIFLELILDNKKMFFNKIFGMLYSSEVDKRIKEKIIQTIGILGLKSDDKNYFIALIRKNINSLIFSIQNNEDIIQKENNVLLLLYYTTYLKFFLDLTLIEKIMEISIDLLLNNENQSIISTEVFNIFLELLNTDIILNNFNEIHNDKFEEYFQFLLIICILEIKEYGINSLKKEISLRILYQIIKIKKIDIYPGFSPKISTNLNKSITNSLLFKEKTKNDNINNIDDMNAIYNLLSLEKEEKINLVEILLQNMIKGESEKSLSIMMDIFGLCGVMEPSKMEKYFASMGLSIYHLEGNLKEEDSLEDNDYKFISNNKNYKKLGKEIDISNIDNSTSKAILLLMRILKENSQQELSLEILSFFSRLIRALSENETNLIDIILPTLIEVMPNFEIKFQKNILENLNLIIKTFKEKIKFYLDEIVKLIINYIFNENYLNIIIEMLNKLFADFVYEMEIYYYILIPILLKILKNNKKETKSLLNIFLLMAENKNIISYLNIMMDELCDIYIISADENIIKCLLDFMKKIIQYDNCNMFYSIIINILLKKLKNILEPKLYTSVDINKLSREKKLDHIFKNSSNSKMNLFILNETLSIFKRMYTTNAKDFIEYLPMILNSLKESSILFVADIKYKIKSGYLDGQEYAFISTKDFLNHICNENCTINCIHGFNSPQKNFRLLSSLTLNISKSTTEIPNRFRNSNIDLSKSMTNLNISSQGFRSRKNKCDNEKIIRIFNNSECSVEEDWYDWFKSSSKILFEESPSFILLTINSLSEYYFPLILELYNYAFLTVYINNNDKNKETLTNMLINAINNKKTPNDILLTILNLIEFIERRNINLSFIDYNQFGNVSYKCRAFAKALYYKENYFLIKNDSEHFEELLELYYEVKLEESAKGLLERANSTCEKKSNSIKQNYYIGINNNINLDQCMIKNNKYDLYIKVHDYEKAIKLIDEQLQAEDNNEKIDELKMNRIMCLNGLCDWETLFSEGSTFSQNNNIDFYGEQNSNTINNIEEPKDNRKNIIEEEIILSKACMNLSEWSELKTHFSNIYSYFKPYPNDLLEQNPIENMDFNIGKKSDLNEEDKNESEITSFLKKNRNTDSPDNDINENPGSFNINNLMNNSKFMNITDAFLRKKSSFNNTNISFIDTKNQNTNLNSTLNINTNENNNNNINEINTNTNANVNSNSNNNQNLNNIVYTEDYLDFISYDKLIKNNPKLINIISNPSESLFDFNLYSSIININDNQFENAEKFIFSAKKIILANIKSLLTESYTRGYELLIKNQQLCLLEQIIEYKRYHDGDENYLDEMVKFWDRGLDIAGENDPAVYEKFLSIRALILPIEKDFEKHMKLSKIYKKMGMYNQCEQILHRIQNKIKEKNAADLNFIFDNMVLNNINEESNEDNNNINNDNSNNENSNNNIDDNKNNLLDEKKIKINLGLNQCLYEKGKISEAVEGSKYLVSLLNKAQNKSQTNILNFNNCDEDNNNTSVNEIDERVNEYGDLSKLNNKLKSKIYGNYAIYKQSLFNFENGYRKSEKKFEEKINELNFDDFGRRTLIINSHEVLNKTSCKNLKSFPLLDEEAMSKHSDEEKDNLNDINTNFILATRYNNTNFNLWHCYAMFNYKLYKSLLNYKNEEKNNENNLTKNSETNYAMNAVEGFKNSIILGRQKRKNIFQDLLRLIDIFFDSSGNNDLINLINSSFDEIEVDSFLIVLPQLLCRFNLKNSKLLSVLISLLIKIGKTYPRSTIFDLIVMKYSNSKKRTSMAQKILNAIIKESEINKKLVEESEMFIKELNNCAILLHEQWLEAIEETSKMYYNKDYSNTVKHLIKLHKKMYEKPENNYDINFYQKFGSQIFEAENFLKEYIDTNNTEALSEAWDIYIHLYANIGNYYKRFEKMSLDYISTKLNKLRNSNIYIPGSYSPLLQNIIVSEERKRASDFMGIKIKKIGKKLKIFKTKQHPRQLTMIGENDKEYLFLLKGHEDLHQDERVMQLFHLVNTIIESNQSIKNKNLIIDTFPVLPLSQSTGIIGWVPNCDTLHQLIKEKRDMSHTIQNNENNKLHKLYPKYETAKFMNKVEIFRDTLKESKALEIKDMIWIKSKNCETWLIRRTNYSRSLAVMSMVGYILGLGDRHPSNLMMSRKTGKIIHIDFGDCFEVAMKRDKFPEKVPFRLTKMLIKALEASGVDGTFKIISEKIMELLRNNKDSLLAILGSFLYDPLISFKLMIPMIIKQRRMGDKTLTKKKQKNEVKNNENIDNTQYIKNNNLSSSLIIKRNSILNLNNFKNNEMNEINEENDLINSPKKKGKHQKIKIDIINEEKEKIDKKMMENDERHIFNLYEENDEIESEELNDIAKIVLERIEHKLSGTDFSPDIIFDVKKQVERLINEAVSYENLAQSYLGWCPFW